MPRVLAALAALALLVFAGGELFAFVASDLGRVLAYRHLHVGERGRVIRIVGRRVREGLEAARVPAGAWREEVEAGAQGGTPHWLVRLPAEGAPMQVNYAVTQAVLEAGAQVLSGREEPGPDGAQRVRLEIGFPGRVLHRVVIERPGRPRRAPDETPPVRLALVLTGAGDEPDLVRGLLARHEPFAVAVTATATAEQRARLRGAAREHGHEVVLQVPMEPENYPRVNPGPGTLLVSMSARRIEGALREHIKDAGDVVAVANFMGSFATQDEPFMTAFYRELRRAGVPFLHVSPVPRAVCRPLAATLGVGYDEPDATLDVEARAQRPAALERAWKSVLERAGHRGQAIVVLRVTPTSAKWLPGALSATALGAVKLVPLSSVVHRPTGH